MLIKLIVGLPGSGKTHYLNSLDGNWIKIDDIMDKGILPEKCDKLAIVDPWFCMELSRKQAESFLKNKYPGCKIETVFFKNEPKKCIENVTRRNDGREVIGFIENFHNSYYPPSDAIPVYDEEKHGKREKAV